ncbi:MAG: YqhA family protein, partial [Burkholderiaceae bacterium]
MPAMIFASRWLQVPLYLGLIVAQAVYVVLFIQELMHLVPILWDPNALAATASTLGVEKVSKEIVVMLVVLSLIDVVMIS